MGSSGGKGVYGSILGPRADWLYSCDPGTRTNTLALGAANRTVYVRRATPIVPISTVTFYVGNQVGNICVSAYAHDPATNKPAARLATTGSIACPAPGEQTVSLGATVSPGWLSIAADDNLATFAFGSGAPLIFASAEGRVCYQSSAFPSPNPAVPSNFTAAGLPVLIGKP